MHVVAPCPNASCRQPLSIPQDAINVRCPRCGRVFPAIASGPTAPAQIAPPATNEVVPDQATKAALSGMKAKAAWLGRFGGDSSVNHKPARREKPSTIYQLKKLVRRNRVLVAASCLVLTSLVGVVIAVNIEHNKTANVVFQERQASDEADKDGRRAIDNADLAAKGLDDTPTALDEMLATFSDEQPASQADSTSVPWLDRQPRGTLKQHGGHSRNHGNLHPHRQPDSIARRAGP